MAEPVYLCIDLKSFYASVECMQRNLDPMTTNLVVADASKTEKTICLAVSPSLKSFGIPGRPRLFEVVQKINYVNQNRLLKAHLSAFEQQSYDIKTLQKDEKVKVSYIVAPPQMALYMQYSTEIYKIYLEYIAPEDMHVYSIDEVFIDLTKYLKTYQSTPRALAEKIIHHVYNQTGITATAGIGTNLYLAKIAMDIVAKHKKPDDKGVRIAELDETKYKEELWEHTPLTDFWRVGRGYQKKLHENFIFTMGDIARCSVAPKTSYRNADFLYKLFGINAELLIDHAWGYEPCTMAHIKSYRPESTSICSGQVLDRPYTYDETRIIVREMVELLALDLVDKGIVTDQVTLTIGYDIENCTNPNIVKFYEGEIVTDVYGRKVPKHAHGTANLDAFTSSTRQITEKVLALFERIYNPLLLSRRLSLNANHLTKKEEANLQRKPAQMDIFSFVQNEEDQEKQKQLQQKEQKLQETMLLLKKKFGKNALLKGTNLQEGATTKQRNEQIGGHKA